MTPKTARRAGAKCKSTDGPGKEGIMSQEAIAIADTLLTNGKPRDLSRYEGENVQIYRDAAHIRQRPGMYIGDTSTKGLHHLAYELVYNSVDEALAGHCNNVHV